MITKLLKLCGWYKAPDDDFCFCTLAIHAPYRQRARRLCRDVTSVPWVVLTDEPGDFADLPVRAIRHLPTGPMAVDYLAWLPPTGIEWGAAAYHDKRFALMAALEYSDTAIFVDADSRIKKLPRLRPLPPGLAVIPVIRKSVAEHLETCGTWRLQTFRDLARHLSGDVEMLQAARWCHETCIAVTRDGHESKFFEAWEEGANFFHSRRIFSGEGGVIGLAAAQAGWTVDYEALSAVAKAIKHEGGGPKQE